MLLFQLHSQQFQLYYLHNLIIIISLCLLIGLFSGLIQPAVIKLTSKLNSNTEVNLSCLFLFQSFAFMIGPAYSGFVAQKYGIYNIWRVDILRLHEIADRFKKEYNLKSSWTKYDPERY